MKDINITQLMSEIRSTIRNLRDEYDRTNCVTFRPIEEIDDHKFDPKSLPRTDNLEFIHKIYLEYLHTIPASPERKDLYQNTYAFPNEELLTEHGATSDVSYNLEKLRDPDSDDIYANISEEWSEKLIDHLIGLANNIREQATSLKSTITHRARKDGVFFCLGDPGVGKTTFINYLCSVYYQKFLDKKIIWIRLDLNDHKERKESFVKSLLFKTIQILREKYEKDIFMYERELRGYIEQRWALSNRTEGLTLSQMNILFERFISLRKYEIEDQLDESFIDAIIRFLINEKGYGFIFFIDGLDRISYESAHEDNWMNWCREITEQVFDKNFIDAVYIISMRDISLIDALTHLYGDELWKIPKRLKIIPVGLKPILDKKFDTANKLILARRSSSFNWLTKEHLDSLKNAIYVYTCASLIDQPLETVNRTNVDQIIEKGFALLNEICGNNYRLTMATFRRILIHVLSSYNDAIGRLIDSNIGERYLTMRGKEYQVKRIAIVGREESNNYSTPYSYSVDGDQVVFQRKTLFHPLIPNIFNYIDEIGASPDIDTQQCRLLVRTRVLQFFKFQKRNGISKQEVINELSKRFGYSRFYINYEILEMIYIGLLKPSSVTDFLLSRSFNIKITPLGLYIIDKLIYDYIYLEIVVDDTPFPICLIDDIRAINRHWKDVSMDEYVSTKIKSTYYFLSCMQETERQEEIHFNQSFTTIESSYENSGYRIVTDVRQFVSQQMARNIRERLINSDKFMFILKTKFGL